MVGWKLGCIVVPCVGLVGACGPVQSQPTSAGDGSGDSSDSGETTSPSESSQTDDGADSTGAPMMCTSELLGDLGTVRTAGISELSGVLEIILGNSPSHECGGLGCDDGWQARIRVDAAATGPQALETAVYVHFSQQQSYCNDPAEPCECPDSFDQDTDWTGTVEIVAQDTDCMLLRFVDTNVLEPVNEQDLPTTFGAVASRCE